MKCPQCGKNIAGKVNFCPWCGYKDENGAMQGKGIRGYATDLIDKAKSIDEAKKKKIIKISVISLIAVILIVTIVILSVTLTSKFRVAKVSKVEIGMTMEKVEKILGKPDDEKLIYSYGLGVNTTAYVYYENKVNKMLKSMDADEDDINSWEDFEKAMEAEEKAQAKLESMKYKSIVISFSNESDKVVEVAFNTDTKYNRANPLKTGKEKQSKEFALNKTFIAKGQSLASADLQYTAKYKDGSYRKGLIAYLDGFSSSEGGVQTLSFDNNWEKKDISLTVKEANITVTSNNEKLGTVKGTGYYLNGQDVTLTATPKNENYLFDGWYDRDTKLSTQNPYTFKMSRGKEIKGIFVPVDWSKEPGFENFTVEQNSEGLTITGVKDKTITSITIPDSVTSIGRSAFKFCSSLTSITIPDSVTSIERGAFDNCPIETATIPAIACSYVNNSNLKTVVITSGDSIGEYAFSSCSSLTSITIPNSVTSIGSYAFWDCNSLTSITIPDSVTSIGRSAFNNCRSLTSITIPDSVTSIVMDAFRDCSSLTSINILDGVTSIGDNAFDDCSSLTSITIPDSVTSIGSYALSCCSSLTSVTFQGTKAQWTAIWKGRYWNLGTERYTVHCTDGDIDM